MQQTFSLTEQSAFGSQYSWRLKESEIRFRGSGDYEGLVLQRIPASEEQIASFRAALDMIQVWDWRDDYDPNDIGYSVADGSAWTFSATLGERSCRCGGVNGYPAFNDPQQTTTDRGRLALLQAALYDCFGIEAYIHQAKLFAARQARQRSEQVAPPERDGE